MLQWCRKKIGSFGDEAGPIEPPTQTCTRLWVSTERAGGAMPGMKRSLIQPSRMFRKLLVVLIAGRGMPAATDDTGIGVPMAVVPPCRVSEPAAPPATLMYTR